MGYHHKVVLTLMTKVARHLLNSNQSAVCGDKNVDRRFRSPPLRVGNVDMVDGGYMASTHEPHGANHIDILRINREIFELTFRLNCWAPHSPK